MLLANVLLDLARSLSSDYLKNCSGITLVEKQYKICVEIFKKTTLSFFEEVTFVIFVKLLQFHVPKR